MLRKQLVVGMLASVVGMLGYSTILPAAPSATVVDSSNDSCIDAGSEVGSLTINDAGVKLEVNGSCSGSDITTPSGLQDIKTVAIDEGTSIPVNLSVNVTVKLPYNVSVTTSLLGQTPTVSGTTAYYKAPVPGTVPVTGGEDSFKYTFADVTGNTATKTVTIPINAVDPDTGTSDCVESETVRCMGELSDWPAGTLFYQAVAAGETHVWHVKYDKIINDTGLFMLFDGGLKTVSLSLKANDFSLSYPCQITQTSPEQAIFYGPMGANDWYQCGFQDQGTYYINIKSTLSTRDPYTMGVL